MTLILYFETLVAVVVFKLLFYASLECYVPLHRLRMIDFGLVQ